MPLHCIDELVKWVAVIAPDLKIPYLLNTGIFSIRLYQTMVKIITVDDHDIYLKGLNLLLQEAPNIEVLGSADNGRKLLELLLITQPDVLLLDMQLPDYEPETLLTEIRRTYPNLPILYHTMMRGTRFLHRLMQHNIQGYILKNAAFSQLLEALQKVANKGTWFSPEIDISHKNDGDYKSTLIVPDHKVDDLLSKREIEVLKLVCKEYSSADIAAKLFLSVSTVDTHRKNIMQRLGVNNSIGLVKFALNQNLLHDD